MLCMLKNEWHHHSLNGISENLKGKSDNTITLCNSKKIPGSNFPETSVKNGE